MTSVSIPLPPLPIVVGALVLFMATGVILSALAYDKRYRASVSARFVATLDRRMWLRGIVQGIVEEHAGPMTVNEVAHALLRYALYRKVAMPEVLPEQVILVLEDLARSGNLRRDTTSDMIDVRYAPDRRRLLATARV